MVKLVRMFMCSAGVILLSTAIAKFVSSFGHGNILQTPDPLLILSFRKLFLAVSGVEVVVALTCFFNKRQLLPAGLVAWLATSFTLYRFCLWKIGWHKPCHCLGNLTDALHIQPQTADTAMKIILAYLLIGSYATLFWLWRQNQHTPSSTSSIKTTVPTT